MNIQYIFDSIWSALQNPTNQAQLVVICIKALVGKNDANTKKDGWVASFRRVDCHPDYRKPICDWCIKIKGDLNTLKEMHSSMTVPLLSRRVICDIIDYFYSSTAVAGPTIWPCCVDNAK